MKAISLLLLPALLTAPSLIAQSLDVGNGQDGNLIIPPGVTTNMALPADGIFRFGTVNIGANAVLRFTNDLLTTHQLNPPVHLLATNYILNNGTIDVSSRNYNGVNPGQGGPGGFDGGFGVQAGSGAQAVPGSGKGPGGGKGTGANATFNYGNALCSPLVGGSGGSGGSGSGSGGGGGGGGALLVASATAITNNGNIYAKGGSGSTAAGSGGSGSGGSIRLVAPIVIGGLNNSMDVTAGYAGIPGRIRIDSTNRTAASSLQTSPVNATSVTRGAQLFSFPPANILEIVQVVAGTNTIPITPGSAVFFSLPAGPDITNAQVRVRAQGLFYNATNVPITVVVTPENGTINTNNASITLVSGAGTNDVLVNIPSGTTSFIHAWTR